MTSLPVIRAGRTLWLHPWQDFKPHLWLVLTDPEGAVGHFIAVRLRTAREYTDTTVVLQAGDHSFVRHASSVDFSTAARFTSKDISKLLNSGRCHLRDDMSEDLLARVREGLLRSPFTRRDIKVYCEERF